MPEEEKYDHEVLRWLEKGKSVKKAIDRASKKYPKDVLMVEEAMIPDLQSRYEYLLEHERIIRTLKA